MAIGYWLLAVVSDRRERSMALQMKSYENHSSLLGDSRSTAVFQCEKSEWLAMRDFLLGAVDGNNPQLKCQSVRMRSLGSDIFCGMAELTCEFAPTAKVEALKPDMPMRFRAEISSGAIVVTDDKRKEQIYKWEEATPERDVPVSITSTMPVTTWKAVLSGARSVANLSMYDQYADTVNSDTFLGAAPETVRFVSASFNPRQLEDGTVVFDVEVHLEYRPTGWNRLIDPDTRTWMTPVKKIGGQKLFEATPYANLLA